IPYSEDRFTSIFIITRTATKVSKEGAEGEEELPSEPESGPQVQLDEASD
ncbi:hypothetical protein OY671_012849, partial [Metschnikowia pulcherrima]